MKAGKSLTVCAHMTHMALSRVIQRLIKRIKAETYYLPLLKHTSNRLSHEGIIYIYLAPLHLRK